jgi:N-acetylglucosamine kinase-like BadF-type ATPase
LREAVGAANANAILHAFYTPEYPRSRVASYARLVNTAAEAGDDQAIQILRSSGRKLGELVFGVHNQLFQAGEQIQIAAIGGTFSSVILRESLDEQLQAKLGCGLTEPKMSPAAGALLQAFRMDGNDALPKGFGLTVK